MERSYLYGVVGADLDADAALPDAGIKGASVTLVESGSVAAVVSALGDQRVRCSRADLSAHERVVEHLAARTTILPLQFGVMLPGEAAVVEDFLAPNQSELVEMIAHLTGKAEHRLKARYLGDVALREVVAESTVIRRLKERIRSRGEAASYSERIQLGELVAAGLTQVKAADAADIVERIGRCAASVVALPDRHDDVALHCAFLVDNDARQRFDDAIDAIAGDFGERMSFELVGPLAPWDFVGEDWATSQVPAASSAGSASGRR